MFNRWKTRDHFSTYFCSQNYSSLGRFICIVKVHEKRGRRLHLNVGWGDNDIKLERLIHTSQKLTKYTRATTQYTFFSNSSGELIDTNKWKYQRQFTWWEALLEFLLLTLSSFEHVIIDKLSNKLVEITLRTESASQ